MPKNCLACSAFWLPKVWSNPVGDQQLIQGIPVPGVDDLLVEPLGHLLVVLDWHGPSLPRCRGCLTATARTIAEAACWVYRPAGGPGLCSRPELARPGNAGWS